MVRVLSLLLLIVLFMAPLLILGDAEKPVCQLTNIQIDPITNGLRITLTTDGFIELSGDPGANRYQWNSQFTVRLNNVRGGVMPIQEVDRYPLSHLEFSLPQDATNGVGLLCTLHLYRQGQMTVYNGNPYGWDDTRWAPLDIPQVMIQRTQQGNQLSIMVLNDRPQLPVLTGAITATPQLLVSGTAERLTLHAVAADIQQVMTQLALSSGRHIYLDTAVRHTITAHLEAMPLARVLTLLSTGYGLSFVERDGAYYISNALADSAAAYWGTVARTIPLHYLMPDLAKSLLPDVLLPCLKVDADQHALVVSGSQQLVDKIAVDLHTLDQPAFQCQVRAWVISASHNDDGVRNLLAQVAGGNTNAQGQSSGALQVTLGAPTVTQLQTNLQALITAGRMQLKAVPMVQVANGNAAELFLGQTLYYWTLSPWGNEQLSSIDAGTRLWVAPRTSGAWVVTRLTLESSFVSSTDALGPLITRQTASTTVRLRSGDTMLVGGLHLAMDDRQHGSPLAGIWPFDRLFASKTSDRSTQDVWVLLQAQASQTSQTAPTSPIPQRG
jgi:type II secretory pathway component GspD/PulD (secretin)